MHEQPSRQLIGPQDQDPQATAPRIPAWVALPAAAGLIAVVALASRSTAIAPGSGSVSIDFMPALTAVEVVGYVGLAVGIGAIALSLVFWRSRPRRPRPGARSVLRQELAPVPWWMNVLAVALLFTVLVAQVVVALYFIAELRRLADEGTGGGTSTGIEGLDPSAFGNAGRDTTSLTIALVIVTGLVVVLVAFAIRARLLHDRQSDANSDPQATTVAAVELSLEALRGERDPRRAVIAAYAAMERSLSRAGFERRRSEAPLEYLRRVLAAPTRVADEVRTITLLFQHAKFSRHAVDETMRTGAIDALERIRVAAGRFA